MPELPEVETVKRGLADLLPGLKIAGVTSDWAKSFPNAPEQVEGFLIGATIQGVRRRAKVLIIDLDNDYSLVIHLKMTGQLVFVRRLDKQNTETRNLNLEENQNSEFNIQNSAVLEERFGAGHPNDSLVNELPDKSTRVIFDLEKASLFFNDQRKFGWVRLLPTIEIQELDFFKKVGPEPLDPSFMAKDFIARVRNRNNSLIKAVLLDQTVVAGVGNIYADESLWGAKLYPATRVRDISDSKLKKLFTELQYVLNLAIDKGGSTDKHYVNAEGKKGSYLSFARVFRREGQLCPRHDIVIVKLRVAGRGTHVCPTCQTKL